MNGDVDIKDNIYYLVEVGEVKKKRVSINVLEEIGKFGTWELELKLLRDYVRDIFDKKNGPHQFEGYVVVNEGKSKSIKSKDPKLKPFMVEKVSNNGKRLDHPLLNESVVFFSMKPEKINTLKIHKV